MKRIFTLIAFITLINSAFAQIATWDFFGQSSPPTSTATTSNANLSTAPVLTRGAGAVSSTASNSFRTTGFSNNGIATTNTDYFQVALTAATGYKLSFSSIDARVAGTASYTAAPGVSQQFAYSLDGATYTLIGSPTVTTTTPATFNVDVSGIPALQNVASTVTVTFRYYASGQTTTGGWGFNSPTLGNNGLAFNGTVTSTVVAVSTISDFSAYKSGTNASLKWAINCNASSLTMELQRSSNGRDFNTIYSEQADQARCAQPFTATDNAVNKGVNYYRLRVKNADGEISYSNIASVKFGGNDDIKVIPTIATNDVHVFYEASVAGKSTWTVYDMSGRSVNNTSAILVKGQNNITVNISNLGKGQYQISGVTPSGRSTAVTFVKQ